MASQNPLLRTEPRLGYCIGAVTGSPKKLCNVPAAGYVLVVDVVSAEYYGDAGGGWLELRNGAGTVLCVGIIGDSGSPHYHQITDLHLPFGTNDLWANPPQGTWDVTVGYHWESVRGIPS